MRTVPPDTPSLFVLYMTTVHDEVIYINDSGSLFLPRYEFDAVCGSEAITTAIGRQMEHDIGYCGMCGHINLADTKEHYAHEPDELMLAAALKDDDDDISEAEFEKMLHGIDPKMTAEQVAMMHDRPFRVCVAYGCIPCEKKTEDNTTTPFVLWARQLFTYIPFPEWDMARKERAAREKKIMHMPYNAWDALIVSGDITDRMSIMATKIAKTWIAAEKPASFPYLAKKKK